MKVDLRQVLNDTGISTDKMQKKKLVDRLECWMSDEQVTHNVNLVKKFISLPIHPPKFYFRWLFVDVGLIFIRVRNGTMCNI